MIVLKILLLVLAAAVFVIAAHLAIFFFTGTVASDAVSTFIWGGAMVIGFVLPVRTYMQWKEEKEQSGS